MPKFMCKDSESVTSHSPNDPKLQSLKSVASVPLESREHGFALRMHARAMKYAISFYC